MFRRRVVLRAGGAPALAASPAEVDGPLEGPLPAAPWSPHHVAGTTLPANQVLLQPAPHIENKCWEAVGQSNFSSIGPAAPFPNLCLCPLFQPGTGRTCRPPAAGRLYSGGSVACGVRRTAREHPAVPAPVAVRKLRCPGSMNLGRPRIRGSPPFAARCGGSGLPRQPVSGRRRPESCAGGDCGSGGAACARLWPRSAGFSPG